MDPAVLKEFNDAVNGVFPEMGQGLLKRIFMNISKAISGPEDSSKDISSAQDEIDRAEANIYNKLYNSGKYSKLDINDPSNIERFRADYPNEFDQLDRAKSKKSAIQQNVIDKDRAKGEESYTAEWFGDIKTYPGDLKNYKSGAGDNIDAFFESDRPQVYKIKRWFR